MGVGRLVGDLFELVALQLRGLCRVCGESGQNASGPGAHTCCRRRASQALAEMARSPVWPYPLVFTINLNLRFMLVAFFLNVKTFLSYLFTQEILTLKICKM